jgi:hypothetical protein
LLFPSSFIPFLGFGFVLATQVSLKNEDTLGGKISGRAFGTLGEVRESEHPADL